MEAVWVAIGILGALLICVVILIYFSFKRRTINEMLGGEVRKLQDKDIKIEEELELRQMKKELQESIDVKKGKIKKLKGE